MRDKGNHHSRSDNMDQQACNRLHHSKEGSLKGALRSYNTEKFDLSLQTYDRTAFRAMGGSSIKWSCNTSLQLVVSKCLAQGTLFCVCLAIHIQQGKTVNVKKEVHTLSHLQTFRNALHIGELWSHSSIVTPEPADCHSDGWWPPPADHIRP